MRSAALLDAKASPPVGFDTGFRLTAIVADTAQLRWWLLSFGSKVEVLESENLRAEMANNAYWMNRMYVKVGSP